MTKVPSPDWLIGLEERVVQALSRGVKPLTAESVLSIPISELRYLANLTLDEVLAVRRKAALLLQRVPPATVLSIWSGSRQDLIVERLTTGCSTIDEALGGGILSRGVTEIAGESGAGKTQICLQLCLTVQLPRSNGGLGGAAMCISTEEVFPHKRLDQLVPKFFARHRQFFDRELALTNKIFIEHAASTADLNSILDRVSTLPPERQFRLLVIDSIAAIYRSEFSRDQGIAKARSLIQIGGKLHRLSHLHNLPIICVNQVTSVMGATNTEDSLVPSLGLAWSNIVTVRIMVSKANGNQGMECAGRRTLRVVFAPHLPQNRCEFVVCEDGVCSPAS